MDTQQKLSEFIQENLTEYAHPEIEGEAVVEWDGVPYGYDTMSHQILKFLDENDTLLDKCTRERENRTK